MTTKTMTALGLALVFACATTAAQAQSKVPNRADQTFMKNAIQGDMAEIEIGQLAQKNGQSEKVKQFGKTLEQDHSANLAKAKTLAESMNLSLPTQPSAKEKATYDKLSKLKGAAFDKQFAKDMVADHKKDISEFQREAKKSGDAADFAKQTLPTLHKHLSLAQSLSSQTTGAK
jgi:putative membrane protein